MINTKPVKAVYRKGAFILRELCNVPEGSEVELVIQDLLAIPPGVTDATKRERILKTVVSRMRSNPIPNGTPPLSRKALLK